MLSSLSSLRHLALRYYTGLEEIFPHLPQLDEAHFYQCELPGKHFFERMPSLKVLVIGKSYCTEDDDTQVCDLSSLADTVETCAWLIDGSAHYYYPLRQLRRVKHLKVQLIQDLFGALEYEIIPSYDGFANLAATVETIEFTVGINPDTLNHTCVNEQDSLEELQYTIDKMEECCRKDWRKVRLVDIRMLALLYLRQPSIWYRTSSRYSIMAKAIRLIKCAKKRFQQELGIELLIS
ncbi:hypothetical protein CSIM01_04935 [Colletotrichum simmondsii]|uniref:Uncharacterized protein n=1 Tax=Colletotrichum simmondsii TaxID=703756 RepID=A0A135SKG7_9PEZI|nr:hypothetical protein CSIM01_04935 [Colletotrichum simmondsii]